MKRFISVFLLMSAIPAGLCFVGGCEETPGIPDNYAGDCPDTPEQKMVYLINRERETSGVPTLDIELRLATAASAHVNRMADQQTLTPVSADLVTRLQITGYTPDWAGENVGGHSDNAEVLFEAWLNDSESRQRLLSANYLHVGVGFTANLTSPIAYYWVVIFASSESAEIPDSGCHP